MTAAAPSQNTTPTRPAREDTFAALRNSNFRLYFAGQLVSTAGTWMQNVAQAVLVVALIIKLTHSAEQSSLWLGIVACAAGLPLVLLSPLTGVIVERIPRRRIMLVTQTTQMLLAFVLAGLAFADLVQVWHVVLLAFLLGITNAVDQPSRQAFIVEMVGRKEMQSGIQLNSILVSASRAIGPALAAIALTVVGTGWCFMLNGFSFMAVIASLLIMKVPYAIPPTKNARPLRQMREGLHYVVTDGGMILPLLLLTSTVGLFGLPLVQFYAAFAATALNSPNNGYSAIIIAQGIGSVLAGALIGWLTFRLGRGRTIAVGVIVIAVVNVLMTRQVYIPGAVVFSFLSGLAIVSSVISINTGIQTLVPDQLRGRVLSLYTLAFFGLSPFGALIAGFIASGIGGFSGIGTANAMLLYAVLGGVFGTLIVIRWPAVLTIGREAPHVSKDAAAIIEADAEAASAPAAVRIRTDTGSQMPGVSDR